MQNADEPDGNGGNNVPVVVLAYDGYNGTLSDVEPSIGTNCGFSTGRNGIMIVNSGGDGVSGTIDSHYYKGQGNREGTEREYVVISASDRPADGEQSSRELFGAGRLHRYADCIGNGQADQLYLHGGVTGALNCMHDQQMIMEGKMSKGKRRYVARRLTPLECCRLQGFPDWWENGANGKDSARYKMWGNGVGLPCVSFVLDAVKRIVEEEED